MTSKEDIIVNSFIFISSIILIFITIYYFCSQTNRNRNRHINILYPPPYGPVLGEITPRYEINNNEDKPPDYQEIYNNITNV